MSNRRIYKLENLQKNKTKGPRVFLSEVLKQFSVNISARRSLLVVIAVVMIFMIVMADLSFLIALTGYSIILVSAAMLPRKGVMQPLVSIRRTPSLQKVETIECQTIMDVMPDPALMLNAHGKVLYMNQGARDIFGPNPLHQHLSSFIREPDFLDAVSKAPRQKMAQEVIYTERVPFERKMRVTISRFKGARNNVWIPSILVTFRDLTEHGRLDQMRSDFIANVSHELRTPLASVLGFIDTIQGAAKDDIKARDNFMKIMRDQVERMTRLINDLLSLSRVEMEAHISPRDRVDLNEIVDYVVKTLEPLADEREISLNIESDLEVADVRGNRDELIQLFQNLVQNAIKYGESEGNVSVFLNRVIEIEGQAPSISVVVKDDGAGIAAEHLPRLTERFYRVNVQSSREKGGTGLGLAIVKHIATRHKGELKITSTLGEGSEFKVLMPEFTNAV